MEKKQTAVELLEQQLKEGYICPQTKKQCDDECCVSAEDCHIKAWIGILSEPKQETLEVKMSKQTAVDWLEKAYWDNKGTLSQKHFDQAKQMEKEQIVESHHEGYYSFSHSGEQYYNETYGGQDE
jgi:alkylhydroperoxidase family enzyme